MASPYHRTGGNDSKQSPAAMTRQDSDARVEGLPTNRPALANVSPNVRAGASTSSLMKPTLTGSPLKRSFTLAMEEGEGLLYLKRRKLAAHETLSDLGRAEHLSAPEAIEEIEEELSPVVFLKSESHVPPSPTDPNTPSERDDSTQGSSVERKSFSSLINYDASSQTSNILFNGPSSAEVLRLRLRVAMYKVRTDQIDVPFSDLKDERQKREEQRRKAIEDAVAELRREAQEVLAREHASSFAGTKLPEMKIDRSKGGHMIFESIVPSSPPAGWSPEKMLQARLGTTPLTIAATSTPPRRVLSLQQDTELTSSAIKGKVAEGLLGLRNAAYLQ